MTKLVRCILLLPALAPVLASAQIDPVKRELVQIGYNQALEGQPPFAGYAFFYLNEPNFLQTNLTLRLALAPVYLDSELGVHGALGANTDVGFGLAGGGFADSYDEISRGRFITGQSFIGHGLEASVNLYHCFNPAQTIPLNGVLRGALHYSTYERDDTDPDVPITQRSVGRNRACGSALGRQGTHFVPGIGHGIVRVVRRPVPQQS